MSDCDTHGWPDPRWHAEDCEHTRSWTHEMDHGIAPIVLARKSFPEKAEPSDLIGKLFRAGGRRFIIKDVEEVENGWLITLGRELAEDEKYMWQYTRVDE